MSKHTGCGRESVVEKIQLRCFAIKNRSKLKKKTCLRIASRNAAWGVKTKSPGNQGKCSYLIWCGLKPHVCSTSWESPPPVTQCIVVSLKSYFIKCLVPSFGFELKIIQKIWQKSRHQKIIKIRKKTEAKLTNGDVVKDEFIHTVKSQIKKLYDKLNYSRNLIGSYLLSIRGKTHKWPHH